MLLDRHERFPEANPELAGRIAQGIQHVFLPDGFRLLLGEHVSSRAGPRAQSNDILAAEAGDRAIQNCGASSAFAEFSGDLRGKSRVCRLSHELQSMPDAPIGDQTEKWRLLKLDRHALRSVSSKTGSPVVFVKPASTTVSLSVSGFLLRKTKRNPAAQIATSKRLTLPIAHVLDRLVRVGASAGFVSAVTVDWSEFAGCVVD
jgi:hypothetical protein